MKKEHKKLERELEQLTDSIDWSEQASIMEKQREIDVSQKVGRRTPGTGEKAEQSKPLIQLKTISFKLRHS